MIPVVRAPRKPGFEFNAMLTVQSHSPAMAAASTVLKVFNARAKGAGWPFHCSLADGFERPQLAAALALWREKAAGRPMPERADLTARAMKPFLTQMSLLERVLEGGRQRYRLRIHGTALARYSIDGTGKFLEEVVLGDRIHGYIALYDTLIEARVPLRVVSNYQAPEIDYLTGETLLAPLSASASGTPLILSVTYAKPRTEIAGGIDALRQQA